LETLTGVHTEGSMAIGVRFKGEVGIGPPAVWCRRYRSSHSFGRYGLINRSANRPAHRSSRRHIGSNRCLKKKRIRTRPCCAGRREGKNGMQQCD
jgi:hypothetical protein